MAIIPILTPHLLVTCIVLLPLAILGQSRLLLGGLVATGVLAVVLLGDEWLSLPVMDPPAAVSVDVVSWNLQFGARTPQQAVATLLDHRTDMVALQELTNDAAAAIQADATLRQWYPYQILEPDPGVNGLGILSAYPIDGRQLKSDPETLTVRVAVDAERELQLMNAHPQPATTGFAKFDARDRDERLRRLRDRIQELLAEDPPVIVAGDFNVASSEPAYRDLASGLRDVHRDVGFGPGWTWRPERLIRFGVSLIRIDYVLTSHELAPRATAVDCAQPGDHCILMATVELPPMPARR